MFIVYLLRDQRPLPPHLILPSRKNTCEAIEAGLECRGRPSAETPAFPGSSAVVYTYLRGRGGSDTCVGILSCRGRIRWPPIPLHKKVRVLS